MSHGKRFVTSNMPIEQEILVRALEDEFRKVRESLDYIMNGNLEIRYAEPAKVEEGIIVYADGTEWNPGHGAGMYEYNKDGWSPLFQLTEGVLVAQTVVDAGVVGTTETELQSYDIPANAFHAGEPLEYHLFGSYDTSAASRSFTVKIKLGGQLLHTMVRQSNNNATDNGWEVCFYATCRTVGATGTLIDFARLTDHDTSFSSADSTVHTIDTTGTLTLQVTLQWDSATVGNIFKSDQGWVKFLH